MLESPLRTAGLLQILSHARVSAQVSTLQVFLFFLFSQSQQEWDLGRFTGSPGFAAYTEKSVCLLLGIQVGGPPRSCNSHKGAFVCGWMSVLCNNVHSLHFISRQVSCKQMI